MKVLIVDDSGINIKVAKKMLEHLGLEVDSVMSGEECLEKISSVTYDIIFMDIMMPEMDGLETFAKLREREEFRVPVVTLTADAVTGAKEKYLSLGFFDYLSKPVSLEDLKRVIEKVNNNKKTT